MGIEPRGLANAINAFIDKGSDDFFDRVEFLLPNHIRKMHGGDLLKVTRGLIKRNMEAPRIFERYLYPLVDEKRKMCRPDQLEEFIELFQMRDDLPDGFIQKLEEAKEYKYNRRKILMFGSGI